MERIQASTMTRQFKRTFSEQTLNELGKIARFCRRERQVTPLQFTDEKIMDPTIRAQLHKVEVVADPEIEALFPELQRVIVKIVTTDGQRAVGDLPDDP